MTPSISIGSWTGLILAFIAYFILGALWFTVLFKKAYRRSLGKEDEPEQKPAPIFIIGPAICTLVITIANALLMNAIGIYSYGGVLLFSSLVGFGFLFSNTVNIAINPNIPRPILYGLISGAYHVVGVSLCCLILFAMR